MSTGPLFLFFTLLLRVIHFGCFFGSKDMNVLLIHASSTQFIDLESSYFGFSAYRIFIVSAHSSPRGSDPRGGRRALCDLWPSRRNRPTARCTIAEILASHSIDVSNSRLQQEKEYKETRSLMRLHANRLETDDRRIEILLNSIAAVNHRCGQLSLRATPSDPSI